MEKKFAFSSEQFFGLICSTVSPLSIRIQGASLGPIIGLPLSRIRFGFDDAVDAARLLRLRQRVMCVTLTPVLKGPFEHVRNYSTTFCQHALCSLTANCAHNNNRCVRLQLWNSFN